MSHRAPAPHHSSALHPRDESHQKRKIISEDYPHGLELYRTRASTRERQPNCRSVRMQSNIRCAKSNTECTDAYTVCTIISQPTRVLDAFKRHTSHLATLEAWRTSEHLRRTFGVLCSNDGPVSGFICTRLSCQLRSFIRLHRSIFYASFQSRTGKDRLA